MKTLKVFCFSWAVGDLERKDAKSHQTSHTKMFSDCVLGVAQMLHVGLKQYYVPQHDPESNVDHLRGNEQLTFRITYPGGPVTRIASLIHSYGNCVDFLWALFQVGGRRDGSVYFFVYRYDTDNCGPLDAARKMQWKMVLPWRIAYPLLKVFSTIVMRKMFKLPIELACIIWISLFCRLTDVVLTVFEL